MEDRNTLRYRMFAGALALASALGALAQGGGFTINGRVKVDGGNLDDVHVVVYKDGQKLRTVTNNLSKFTLDLDINASYVLSFEKSGFVTKKLSFDTHAPAEAIANGFTPFDFAVSIFKQYDDVNTVVFNQPVGMIRYDKNVDDFDYDTDYTKSIQSALQETQAAVEKKQQEEKAKEEADAKMKEKAEKDRLKAEAEKAKQDAEAAKQQAKQQKEQEEAARKEQERKDAEAKKAAEDKRKADEAAQKAAMAEAKKPKEEPKPAPKKEVPPPPPPPVAKAKPKPAPPKPQPVVVQHNFTGAKATEGSEGRRGMSPKVSEEASRVQKAKPTERTESKPEEEAKVEPSERHEQLLVEHNEVITVVKIKRGDKTREYRRVVRKYGGVHYFKDGQSCSQLVYEKEALADTPTR